MLLGTIIILNLCNLHYKRCRLEVEDVAHFWLQGVCTGRLVQLKIGAIIQTGKGLQSIWISLRQWAHLLCDTYLH